MNNRVNHLRKNILHLTQSEFGEKIGISKTAISKIEKGETTLTERNMKSICREFNVSIAWLKDGVGEPLNNMDVDFLNKVDQIISGEDEFYKNILRTIVNLSDEDLLLFKRVVDELAGENNDK